MQLLVCLAGAKGELVSRDALMEEIWPRAVVADVLNNTVANLRKALGDTSRSRRYIETIPKQGYRFIPVVSWESDSLETASVNKQKIASENIISDAGAGNKALFFASHKFTFLFIVALIVITIIYVQSRPTPKVEPDSSASGELKTLAVLPFDTYSDQSNIKFFTDGLVEELIHQLAANPSFRVIARTSSESFRNSNVDIKQISSVLGARYIMEGSVRQSDEKLRITVQLSDAQNGFHIWSRTFDHEKDDNVLDTQIAIGRKVAALIGSGENDTRVYQSRKHPSSAEAYRVFLIAQSHMKFTEVNHLEKALEYFHRAIEIAPDYAIAYTGIAAAQLLLYQYKHVSLSETTRLSSEALNKALSIEPNLAEAFAVRGLQETYLHQFDLAEDDFQQALELNPGLRFARHNYGFLLWRLYRPEDAIVQFEIALEMDPLSSITNFAVGDVLGSLGEFERAIAHYLQCQELLPEDYTCFLGMANVYKLKGNFEQYSYYLGLSAQRAETGNFWQTIASAMNALVKGDLTESRVLLLSASDKNSKHPYLLKTSLILALRTTSLDLFTENIKQLIIENPNDFDLNLLLGLSSYFESDCKLAIAQYERVNKEFGTALLEVWDFALGVSHVLNLAYCYQQESHHKEAQDLLDKYHLFIQSLPASASGIPGIVYSQARYLALSGQLDEAEILLQQIQDWPFIWLYDYDPLWTKPAVSGL